jgi:hypothetical protein
MNSNYFYELPTDIIEHIVKQNDETLESKINDFVPSLKFAKNLEVLDTIVKNINKKIHEEFKNTYKRNDIIRLRRQNGDDVFYVYFVVYQVKDTYMKTKLLEPCEERGMFEYFKVIYDTLNVIHLTDCDKYEMYSSMESRKEQRLKIANKLNIGDRVEIQIVPTAYIYREIHYGNDMNERYLTTANVTKITNKFIYFEGATRNMEYRSDFNYGGHVLKENVMYKHK